MTMKVLYWRPAGKYVYVREEDWRRALLGELDGVLAFFSCAAGQGPTSTRLIPREELAQVTPYPEVAWATNGVDSM